MLHQMQQGAKPFKRPKVTKPNMTSTFEQELHNILGVTTKDTKENLTEQEDDDKTGMKLGPVAVGSIVEQKLNDMGIKKEDPFKSSKQFHGIKYSQVKVANWKTREVFLKDSGFEDLFVADNETYFDVIVEVSNVPPINGIYLDFSNIDKDLSLYKSRFAALKTIYDRGGDVNQLIRIFSTLFSDFCMPLAIVLEDTVLSPEKKKLMEELAVISSFASVLASGKQSIKQTFHHRMVDLLLMSNTVAYMSLQASLTEKLVDEEERPRELSLKTNDFQSVAEKQFQEKLLEAASEYTTQIVELKASLRRLNEIQKENEDDLDEETKNRTEVIISNIREVGIEPITKSKQQLDIIAQLKKDLAVKILEVKKLTKQLGNGTGGGGGGGTYLSQGSTSLSKEEQLLNKKTFDLLLPLKIREVFMKYPAYRYGLTLAGKIHLRNEQSIFVTDITQLVYIQHESNPLSSTIPKIDESYVKIQVEQARTRYLGFLHSPATDILSECMQLLTPTMVSVLQTCLNETKKLVELETNRRITAEELLCPKGGNTASEGLYDKFTSWVAAVYISDQQIQKNIATTQSDKNAQNLSRLKTILDLRQGLIDMGYRVKPNPYSMA